MEFLGLTLADFEAQNTVHVWPDNWRAVLFLKALGMGAWNMGPGGPVGIRPESFSEVRRAMRITDEEWPEIFAAVQAMEPAALDEMHKDE